MEVWEFPSPRGSEGGNEFPQPFGLSMRIGSFLWFLLLSFPLPLSWGYEDKSRALPSTLPPPQIHTEDHIHALYYVSKLSHNIVLNP